MITVEAWTTIRYLRAQGKTIRAIARELGLSRNTVRAALREENPPTYTRLPRANPKLAPFLPQIEEMVVGQKFIGSRILRELRALGYRGGPAALYSYLRQFKATHGDSRVSERFETPPAQQGQLERVLSLLVTLHHLSGFRDEQGHCLLPHPGLQSPQVLLAQSG